MQILKLFYVYSEAIPIISEVGARFKCVRSDIIGNKLLKKYQGTVKYSSASES
jgi:hypothetical protein